MLIERPLTEEEAALAAAKSRSSWTGTHPYGQRDLDGLVAIYAPDAISIPANHRAMVGHDEIRAWYAKRTGDYEMNVVTEVDAVDVVGEVAVLVGTFRVTRRPEDGVAALDHGGRWLSIMRKVDGEWRMWRDMDTPSPDADKYYGRLERGW